MKILKCRKCGEEIYPDEERCSHCGASLKWLRNLAPCRDCGELVSKTASRCPYCGVRYPNKIWFATQLVSAIVLFFCGCYCINILLDTLIPTETTYPSTSEPSYQYSEPEHKPIEISAEQLWREFKYDRTYSQQVRTSGYLGALLANSQCGLEVKLTCQEIRILRLYDHWAFVPVFCMLWVRFGHTGRKRRAKA